VRAVLPSAGECPRSEPSKSRISLPENARSFRCRPDFHKMSRRSMTTFHIHFRARIFFHTRDRSTPGRPQYRSSWPATVSISCTSFKIPAAVLRRSSAAPRTLRDRARRVSAIRPFESSSQFQPYRALAQRFLIRHPRASSRPQSLNLPCVRPELFARSLASRGVRIFGGARQHSRFTGDPAFAAAFRSGHAVIDRGVQITRVFPTQSARCLPPSNKVRRNLQWDAADPRSLPSALNSSSCVVRFRLQHSNGLLSVVTKFAGAESAVTPKRNGRFLGRRWRTGLSCWMLSASAPCSCATLVLTPNFPVKSKCPQGFPLPAHDLSFIRCTWWHLGFHCPRDGIHSHCRSYKKSRRTRRCCQRLRRNPHAFHRHEIKLHHEASGGTCATPASQDRKQRFITCV